MSSSYSSLHNAFKLRLDEKALSEPISRGVRDIAANAPDCFHASEGLLVRFEYEGSATVGNASAGFGWELDGGIITLRYGRACEAFRLLGILMGHARSGIAPQQNYHEHTPLKSLGLMLDVSRNGVMRLDVLEGFIQSLALMGLNCLMLYTEDTYEIPGEPMFGYGRGGYSQADIRKIDDFASCYGIEMVPCIQTLGHLEQVLKWPCYGSLRDTPNVIRSNDEGASAFIEKMLTAASEPVRSRRIHIGMDEAFGIGTGSYRLRNGLKEPFEVLSEHLKNVCEMCNQMGLEPMIWSDMFFRLGSKDAEYYDMESTISQQAIDSIPDNVDLVYWDYYHHDKSFYDEWISRHRQMGKEPVFAPGILSWNRFWANLPFSFSTLRAGMSSARENGLKEALLTAWGDDGMECDILSILPGIQFFAELAYAESAAVAEGNLELHFRGSCNGSLAHWLAASALDAAPGLGQPSRIYMNPSKWILWHDPLLGVHEPLIAPGTAAHYESVAARITQIATEAGDADSRLDFPAALAHALALKAKLHETLRPAYVAGDRDAIARIIEADLPELKTRVRNLWKLHNARWHSLYHPEGWEVIDQRYGGLLARLETTHEKLESWLKGQAGTIAELDIERHAMWPREALPNLMTALKHRTAATPSVTFGS